MSVFPTLSVEPVQVISTPVDNAIKSTAENDSVISRKRGTKDPWRFEVSYEKLLPADVALLKHPTTGFWKTVGTYGVFSWTYDGSTYSVRFESPFKITGKANRGSTVSFALLTA